MLLAADMLQLMSQVYPPDKLQMIINHLRGDAYELKTLYTPD